MIHCKCCNKKYTKNTTGIILDNETNLEWYVSEASSVYPVTAKQWIEKINRENLGGGNWRFPTMKELKQIATGKKEKCVCTLFIENGGHRYLTVWCFAPNEELPRKYVYGLDQVFELNLKYYSTNPHEGERVFAVRI